MADSSIVQLTNDPRKEAETAEYLALVEAHKRFLCGHRSDDGPLFDLGERWGEVENGDWDSVKFNTLREEVLPFEAGLPPELRIHLTQLKTTVQSPEWPNDRKKSDFRDFYFQAAHHFHASEENPLTPWEFRCAVFEHMTLSAARRTNAEKARIWPPSEEQRKPLTPELFTEEYKTYKNSLQLAKLETKPTRRAEWEDDCNLVLEAWENLVGARRAAINDDHTTLIRNDYAKYLGSTLKNGLRNLLSESGSGNLEAQKLDGGLLKFERYQKPLHETFVKAAKFLLAED
jgi:hypothetical protein